MDRLEKRMNNIVNTFKGDRKLISISYGGIEMNHSYHRAQKFIKIVTKFNSRCQQFMFGLLMAGYIKINMPIRYRREKA